uniref:Uncharacterized protein n=1 Tax=Lepeophtheirus salmonis TaxID=72036 RepID=A0A0K2V595_LEPSM
MYGCVSTHPSCLNEFVFFYLDIQSTRLLILSSSSVQGISLLCTSLGGSYPLYWKERSLFRCPFTSRTVIVTCDLVIIVINSSRSSTESSYTSFRKLGLP